MPANLSQYAWLTGDAHVQVDRRWVIVDIVSAPVTEGVTVQALRERVEGYLTHFVREEGRKGRTYLCTRPSECRWCDEHRPKKWKGFLPSYHFAREERVIMEITDHAMPGIDQVKHVHGKLTSVSLHFWRCKPRPNGPVSVKAIPLARDLAKLPADFDPLPTILLTHGYEPAQVHELMHLRQQMQ